MSINDSFATAAKVHDAMEDIHQAKHAMQELRILAICKNKGISRAEYIDSLTDEQREQIEAIRDLNRRANGVPA